MQCDNEIWSVCIILKNKNSYKKILEKTKACKFVPGLFSVYKEFYFLKNFCVY